MTDAPGTMDIALPAEPAVLRKVALVLEKTCQWKALFAVLEAMLHLNPADWRALLQYTVALEGSGNAAGAQEVIARYVSGVGFTTAARKRLLEQLFERDSAGLVAETLKEFAKADAKGLVAYAGSVQGVARRDTLLHALRGIDVPGWDPLQVELIAIEYLEQSGRTSEADQAYAAIETALTIEASPHQGTPTPSTLMFRNRPLLDRLVSAIGWLVERNGRVSVHVGACSTGEDAYSLALLLAEAGLIGSCELSASDVDPSLVRRARTGVVDAKSAVQTPEAMLGSWFQRQRDGRFRLDPEILGQIGFSVIDLGEPADHACHDILIANNVLVHFPAADANRMLRRMVGRLRPSGLLCIGGSRQDSLQATLDELGLVPVLEGAGPVFEGWRLQRHAWYVNPRPYWALPPARFSAGQPWRHCAFFTRDGKTAAALKDAFMARGPDPS